MCNIHRFIGDGKYAQSSHFEGFDKSVTKDAQGLGSFHDAGTPLPDNPSNSKLGESTPSSERPRNNGDRKRKRPAEAQPTSNQTRKDVEIVDTMAGALLEMVAAWRSKNGSASMQADDGFSITNCIKALRPMMVCIWLLRISLKIPIYGRRFFSLKDNRLRLQWLQGKSGRSSSPAFF